MLAPVSSAIVTAIVAIATAAGPPPYAAAPDLSPYAGPGTWIDRYDVAAFRDPRGTVERMRAAGVRTLYLETSSWKVPGKAPIIFPQQTAALIDGSHAAGIRVVAWYLPSLGNFKRDLRRSLAAIRLRTPAGGGFDSFALDIESTNVNPIPRRNAALMKLSRAIRAAAGPAYALGAIVPDQRSSSISPGLWPGFPHAEAARVYDVFLPMAYSTLRGRGARFVYSYMRSNVAYLRARTGRPVHPIAGLAHGLNGAEAAAAMRAARDGGAMGASFYEYARTGPEDWRALGRLGLARR